MVTKISTIPGQTIHTKFLAPTNHRATRVKATCEAGSVEVGWSYEGSTADEHVRACQKLLKKLGWDGEWVGGASESENGYTFIRVGENCGNRAREGEERPLGLSDGEVREFERQQSDRKD